MGNWRGARYSGGVLAALASILVLGVQLAAAEELSREGWVERVEPICKANVLANKRIFQGAKQEVREGKLKKASGHFKRAAAAFAKTIGQIEAVQPPASDQVKVDRWLDYLRDETVYVRRIGSALAAERRHKAETISVQLNRNSTRANNAGLGFGFEYCRIDPARFG